MFKLRVHPVHFKRALAFDGLARAHIHLLNAMIQMELWRRTNAWRDLLQLCCTLF